MCVLPKDVSGMTWGRCFGFMTLAVVLLLGGFAGLAFGQAATGALTGTVTDAQGAAMVGVSVVVHNADTGIDMKPVLTNDSGIFLVPLLPPGSYDITTSQAGFASVKRQAVTIQVGQTIRIDFEMPVASQQALVTVTTEVPLLETEKTEQSQNVSENLVSSLPVSSRRWEQFVFLTPGVNPDGASGAVSFHGLNSLYNNNSVDGANNSSNYGGGARGGTGDGYIYSGDSIREFQVSSSGFSAELGQAAGGAVNAVTKSGTNQFHGDAFYNGRAANFNAIDPLASINAAKNGQVATQAVHQQHQYGVSVGGPLVKDKLFFFTTLDGYRKVNPLVTTTSQLTPSINDFVCPTLPSGSTYSQTLLNSQCAAAKAFVFKRVVGTFSRTLRQDVELLKLDYQLNAANHINAVTNFRDYKQPTDSTSVNGNTSFNQDRFVITNWTTVIGNNKVNDFRFQWGYDLSFSSGNYTIGAPQSRLANLFTYGSGGGTGGPGNTETRYQISDNFSWTKGTHAFKFGADINLIRNFQRSATNSSGLYQYSGAVAFATGITCTNPAAQTPNNIFCNWLVDAFGVPDGASTGKHWGTYTQVVDNVEPGFPQTFAYNFPDRDYAAYVQDTWKARPNLTINFGLRYDAQVLPETVNSLEHVCAEKPATCGTYTVATLPPILDTYTTHINNEYATFQPRLGIAWNFSKNSVLRLGGGLYYAKTPGNTIKTIVSGAGESNFNCSSPAACAAALPSTINMQYPDVLFLQQDVGPQSFIPGARAGNVLVPQGTIIPSLTIPNSKFGIRGIAPDAVRPRAYEFQAALEQRLPGNLNLSLSYVFTRGNHLPSQHDGNLAINVDTNPTAVIGGATVANPNLGKTITKTYDVVDTKGVTQTASTVPLFFNRIDSRTGPIIAQFTNVNTTYHGFIVSLRKPMSHGFEVLTNYTLSRATDNGQGAANLSGGGSINSLGFVATDGIVDPFNMRGEQGYSGVDARNRFTTSVVWQPTWGRGSTGAVRQLVSGWSLASTILATNGTRYSATVSSTSSQSVTLNGVSYTGLQGGMSGALIQTTADPIGGRVAWLPRNSFVLPNLYNVDLRLAKRFDITERFNLEIRGEAFNLFNTTLPLQVSTNAYTYAAPSGGATSACPNSTVVGAVSPHTNTCMTPVSTFQTWSTTSGNLMGARQLQAGIRFNF